MKTIAVTGAQGFIGKNLVSRLAAQPHVQVIEIDARADAPGFRAGLARADAVVHLAGVNRPSKEAEFEVGNAGSIRAVTDVLREIAAAPLIVLTSSTQAELDNAYGRSKASAETVLQDFTKDSGADVHVMRLPGVFGKWCKPNYNSVVATFCYNRARGLPIKVDNPSNVVRLVYIDDVVDAIVSAIDGSQPHIEPVYPVSLQRIVDVIEGFASERSTLFVPDLADDFVRKLHATYKSYLPLEALAYGLRNNTDPRGTLAELLKSPAFGQIFVSRTNPGIKRGDHFHHSKVEKFCIIEGTAVVRFRSMATGETSDYTVSGIEMKVIDIPPGTTHNIENVGANELIVLFWASEVFDPQKPDTYLAPVTHD